MDHKVKYFYKKNGGLSSARNEGLENAKGEYISFLDADDVWESEKISNQLLVLEKEDADIVYSEYFEFYDDNTSKPKRINFSNKNTNNIYAFIAGDPCSGSASSIILKKKVVEDIGLFDRNLRSCEDLDYWFRCKLQGYRFGKCSTADVGIRIHKGSMSKNFTTMYFYHLIVLEKQINLLKEADYSISDNQIIGAIRERLGVIKWYGSQDKRMDRVLYAYVIGVHYFGIRYFNKSVLIQFGMDLYRLFKILSKSIFKLRNI